MDGYSKAHKERYHQEADDQGDISEPTKTVLNCEERQSATAALYPIAAQLHALCVTADSIDKEISVYRQKLVDFDLGDRTIEEFQFGDTGNVRVKKSPLKFSASAQARHFNNLTAADTDKLKDCGFLEAQTKIVPDQEFLKQLSEQEISKLIEDHPFLKRQIFYKPAPIILTEDNGDLVSELIDGGILEMPGNTVRVQRVKPGRKSKRGKRSN